MSEFDPVSFIMGAKSAGGGGGGGGGYDIVLRLDMGGGDDLRITQISMDFNAVKAKAEALQPITALVYNVDHAGDYTSVATFLSTAQAYLYHGSFVSLNIVTGIINNVQEYIVLAYDPDGDEWFED